MNQIAVNENFFGTWSSEMSYVLGFVTADGCLSLKKDITRRYILNITSKDRKILQDIRKVMLSEHKIYKKHQAQDDKKDCFYIQFGHKKICQDLINLGIHTNKTNNLGPIKVPNRYFSHFVRGFFDGDGTVYIYNVNGTPQIKAAFISCSLSFIQNFNQRLCESLNVPIKSLHKQKPHGSKLFQYTNYFYVNDCERLSRFMYNNNSAPYLSRKKNVFERWKLVQRRKYRKKALF